MTAAAGDGAGRVHEVAAVVPVYRGADTLDQLVGELLALAADRGATTPGGRRYAVTEIVLVHDCGPDASGAVIRRLAEEHPIVRPVWLSRNFGQHPATIAGIASTTSPWVATLDEDGQHIPADIGVLLDTALDERAGLVYGQHAERPPHPGWRNRTSALARVAARLLSGSDMRSFSSFRLVLGSHARAVAAYCGPRTYLDVALTWALHPRADAVVGTRAELREGSGYDFRRLLTHFWTLVLSTGTRPLRVVSALGFLVAAAGLLAAVVIVVVRLTSGYDAPGWASVIVALLMTNGLVLLALGVIAEYVGALLLSAQGRPLYIIVDDPADGPLADPPPPEP